MGKKNDKKSGKLTRLEAYQRTGVPVSGGGGAAQAIASHFQLLGRNQVQHQWKVSLMGI